MRPKSPPPEQPELFRSALMNLVDPRHPLVRLAGLIDWHRFAAAFGPLYRDGVGRPGLPTRLMVGLHLIKHMDGLSDEAVCARFLDSPYVQLFCGETHFQHALPLDRSSMTRWRKRIGAERIVAGIDFALEPLRLLARGGDRPCGPGADREAALAAGDAIAEKEAALAGAKDEDAEARDLVVIDEHVAVDRRHQCLYGSLGQMLLHARH